MTILLGDMLQDIVDKKRKVYEVAEIFKVSRKSVSQWLYKYKRDGISGIVPRKPGPKSGETHNRTDSVVEDEVCRLGKENLFEGPIGISDEMYDLYNINIDQSTVYRILKRKNIRYYLGYHGVKKKRILYVKDIPGRELQLDVSFPWGYQRKICIYWKFDADISELQYSLTLWTNYYNSRKKTLLTLNKMKNSGRKVKNL